MASESFEEYRRRNPQVEELLYKLAIAELAKKPPNKKHLSMKHIWEIARAFHSTAGGNQYKYSNDHTASYARLLMAKHPDLAGVFTTKKTRKGEPLSDEDIHELLGGDPPPWGDPDDNWAQG